MAFRSRLRNSSLCAVSLLEALDRKSGEELSRRLESAAELRRAAVEDTAEGERMEVLDGIAAEIRQLVADGGLERARVYTKLLWHLATPAPVDAI